MWKLTLGCPIKITYKPTFSKDSHKFKLSKSYGIVALENFSACFIVTWAQNFLFLCIIVPQNWEEPPTMSNPECFQDFFQLSVDGYLYRKVGVIFANLNFFFFLCTRMAKVVSYLDCFGYNDLIIFHVDI
jgi:hypothetical protein